MIRSFLDLRTVAGRATLAMATLVGLLVPIVAPIASGRVFHADDLGAFHLPMRILAARSVAQGDDPRWQPAILCGFDLHGEGQLGLEHPVLRLVRASLPLPAAFGLEIAGPYAFLAVGMVLWIRRLGLPWDSALLGALLFVFSGFILLRYVHPNALGVMAHWPWLLLAIASMRRNPRASFLAVGLLTTSEVLLGYPQYVAFSGIAEMAAAMVTFRRDRSLWLRWLAAKGLGLGGGMAQVLPTLESLRLSTRGHPSAVFLGMDSLHPMDLLQIVAPAIFRAGHHLLEGRSAWPRHESAASPGAVVPALLAWLAIRRSAVTVPGVESRAIGTILTTSATIAVGSYLLALGAYSPLFPILIRVPLWSVFRGPARFLGLGQAALAVMAAIAFADLSAFVSRRRPMPRARLGPLALPALAGMVATVTVLSVAGPLRLRGIAAIGPATLGLLWPASAAILVAGAARGYRLAPALLIVLAAADSVTASLAPLLRHDRPETPERLADAEARPPRPHGDRIVAPFNRGSAGGARLVGGYVGLTPRRGLDVASPAALRIAGVGWIRAEGDHPSRWILVDRPLPRARLVDRVVVDPDPASALARVDPATTVCLTSAVDVEPGAPGSATIQEDRPGRIRVVTESSGRRFLMVNEAWHPGWRAELDGRVAEVIACDGDYLGVPVAGGRHEVVFRFDPASHRRGRWASIGSLAALVLIGSWPGRLTSGAACFQIGRREEARARTTGFHVKRPSVSTGRPSDRPAITRAGSTAGGGHGR